MPRSLTAATQAAAEGQRAEYIHLLELNFSGGTIRYTSGPHAVLWNAVSWSAVAGGIAFEQISESADPSSQRVRLRLDGVSLITVSALLGESYIGRTGRLYRAHFAAGLIVDDPVLLFLGLMNAPWEVAEDLEGKSASVETELVSPLTVFGQRRGIVADVNSHQEFFENDTFFRHISSKPEGSKALGEWHLPVFFTDL